MPLYTLVDDQVQKPEPGRYWVAPGAALIGKVTLGEDCSVWFNAVLRADNEPVTVGARTNIQEGCVIHVDPGFPVTIQDNCTIGHMAMLHGCTVERGALIGIGAIVLNGAVIGEGSLVGAGTLITEGKYIPPGSVVMGRPGKVVRSVSAAERNRIDAGVDGYVARWKTYANALVTQTERSDPVF